MVRYGGIDYSLTSPSICLYIGDKEHFSFEETKIFFLASQKKYFGFNSRNFNGSVNISDFSCPEQRYNYISDWAFDIVIGYGLEKVFIEDYSYNSTGKVFNLAENCGLLKWKLWVAGINIQLFPPTTVKKFATGKGNANKELMYENFLIETGVDLQEELGIKSKKIGNPVSDIVDSYYICKMGVDT